MSKTMQMLELENEIKDIDEKLKNEPNLFKTQALKKYRLNLVKRLKELKR